MTETTTNMPLPPGSFGLPVVGESINFLADPDFADKRQQKYGSIFKTRILGRPTVVMVGPEAAEFVLSSHINYFSWRGGWPDTFKELLGESLFLQEGEEHRRNRRLLMPAFHGKALEGYFDTMTALSDKYLSRWQQLGEFTWFDEMKQFTFEVASVLLLGTEPGEQIEQLSRWFTQLTNGLFMVPIRWGWTPYGRALKARNHLLDYIEERIHERKQSHDAQGRADVLTLLLETVDEDGGQLSLEEIKAQSLLMLFAGHETTTSMLTSLVMALAQHPDCLERARAEQQALPKELSMETMRQMPYLDQVLKEVERLYPPVGGGFRQVEKPFEFNGYHVPAGWMALYRIVGTHKDPRCFTDPASFDPDRFGPERAEQKRFGYSLVGFGGGPRVCLGLAFAQLEMKIMAARLLRHYQWELLPGQDLSMLPIPTLRPASGLKVRMQSR